MLGSRNAGSRLGLVLELRQFFAQARRFGAILCRLDMVLDGGDAAHGIENPGNGVVLAFADMFDLVGKVVLVLCVALQTGNAALKILNVGPALSPCEGSVVDTRGGRLVVAAFLQVGRKKLKIVLAFGIAQVGRQLVPAQGP